MDDDERHLPIQYSRCKFHWVNFTQVASVGHLILNISFAVILLLKVQ